MTALLLKEVKHIQVLVLYHREENLNCQYEPSFVLLLKELYRLILAFVAGACAWLTVGYWIVLRLEALAQALNHVEEPILLKSA